MLYLGMGALSHCLLDCLNISGVALLKPVTKKIFVLASQRYRIGTGSRQEFILMMTLGFVSGQCFKPSWVIIRWPLTAINEKALSNVILKGSYDYKTAISKKDPGLLSVQKDPDHLRRSLYMTEKKIKLFMSLIRRNFLRLRLK
jgi:membrane-bound metal-dependent hydrolase YbcI (DUF457 family)